MTESQQSYNFLYKSDAKGTLETLKRHINEIESQIARLQSDRSTDKLDNIGSTNNIIQMYIIIFINLYFLLLCKNIENFNEIEVNKIKEVLPSIDDFINDYKKNNLNYYDNIEENIKNISTIAKMPNHLLLLRKVLHHHLLLLRKMPHHHLLLLRNMPHHHLLLLKKMLHHLL